MAWAIHMHFKAKLATPADIQSRKPPESNDFGFFDRSLTGYAGEDQIDGSFFQEDRLS